VLCRAVPCSGPISLTFTGVTVLESSQTIRVGSLQGPGITGSNLWLLRDPTPAADIPGYSWPASLAAAAVQSDGSYSRQAQPHGLSPGSQAAIGVSVGLVGLLAVVGAALLMRRQHRRRSRKAGLDVLPKSQLHFVDGLLQDGSMFGGSDAHGPTVSAGGVPASGGAARADVGPRGHRQDRPGSGSVKAAAAGSAAADILKARLGSAADRVSSRGSSMETDSAAAAASDCTPHSAGKGSATGDVNAAGAEQSGVTRRSGGSGSSSAMEQSIAQGLERWSAAVSATTMQLMKRRLQVNNHSVLYPASSGSGSNSGRIPAGRVQALESGALGRDGSAVSPSVAGSAAGRPGSDSAPPLQLQSIIGTGSFGSVYLGTWRGKQVAVKVMHLTADAMADSLEAERAEDDGDHDEEEEGEADSLAAGAAAGDEASGQQDQRLRHRQLWQQQRRWQRRQNSPPHMAIMEAVVSSTMCHPNVTQVYTYMLTPLMARDVEQQQQAGAAAMSRLDADAAGQAAHHKGLMSGWQLRLVMEYCAQVWRLEDVQSTV